MAMLDKDTFLFMRPNGRQWEFRTDKASAKTCRLLASFSSCVYLIRCSLYVLRFDMSMYCVCKAQGTYEQFMG